jgi:carbamoyl-phosphate synthase small subunit
MNHPAVLVLADGSRFSGFSIGYSHSDHPLFQTAEVVFNTAMTGYQEILTDPSYTEQMVCLTYPHIGNTGINDLDNESHSIYAKALIIRDLSLVESNWQSKQTLDFFLKTHRVPGIADIDTRELTRVIRDKGAQMGCLVVAPVISEALVQQAIALAKTTPGLDNLDLAIKVTTPKTYSYCSSPLENSIDIFVYDFGVKQNILRMLEERNCKVTVVPADFPVEKIIERMPDGVLLSNGPGDPKACHYAIENTKKLWAKKIPLFGICLGHQILGLSLGAKTLKMKLGHHGANHPVFCRKTKKVFITSQNHGFAIDELSLPKDVFATHHSLFDGSLQGIKHQVLPAFGFQGHPEASPGPQEIGVLFDEFMTMAQLYQQHKLLQAV